MNRSHTQIRLNPEQAKMKEYLKNKGYNISVYLRNYLISLYEQEIKNNKVS